MVEAIIVGVVVIVLGTATLAFAVRFWRVSEGCRAKLISLFRRGWQWIAPKLHLRHVETPEEQEGRQYWKMMESEDPNIWKPLSQRNEDGDATPDRDDRPGD